MGYQLACVLITPLQMVVGIVMMYWFIGISFISGIVVMILTIALTFFLTKFIVRYNEGVLKAKD